ncbi:TonB-dependent receptor [Parasphingorhabdus sp.]|uniref:TonB-dependent receptor n=1 Tax=Parasphingorhabdus sp. TaxID=2709688 RepID=UPI003A8E88D0
MKLRHTYKAGTVIASLCLGLPGMAMAQTIEDTTANDTDARLTDEDSVIVVTATKRSQDIQEIPASISSIGGDKLEARGLTSIEDIANAVPNLNFGDHIGTTLITIRGVGSTVDSGVTEPTVATYVDGALMPRSTMSLLKAIDLERVEVLRGPQGTLYGRNATGGAINFVSSAPTTYFSGEVNLSTGSRNAFAASGFLSGPIAEGVYFRVSGGHEEQDGYVRLLPSGKAIGNENTDYVRGALRLEPSSTATIDLAVRYEKATGVNGYQQLLSPTALVPAAIQTTEPNVYYANSPFGQSTETLVATGTVNWEFADNITLRTITSYVDHTSIVFGDSDGTGASIVDLAPFLDPALQAALPASTPDHFRNLPGFYRPSESFAQEINLIGETGPVEWIAGAYYFHEDFEIALPVIIFGVAPLAQAVSERTNSYALFGDATISLTNSLRLNLGLRYNHESKDFKGNLFADTTALGGGPVALGNVPSEMKSDRLLPKVGVQYDFSDDVHSYVQWQRGYKSGGQNLQFLPQFGPEQIDAFEAGLKTRFADRRVTANFAAFYYDYNGLQMTTLIPPTTTAVRNADARVYGLEAEFGVDVMENLNLSGAVTYLNARFQNFSDFDAARGGLAVDLDGSALPHAPDFTAQAAAEYKIPLGDGFFSDLTLRGDIFHSSSVVLRYFGRPSDTQSAYTIANASATLSMMDKRASLRFFVNNVGDKVYLQNITYAGQLPEAYLGNYSKPREWGLSLSYRF